MQFGNRRKTLTLFICEGHTTAYCRAPGVQHPVSLMKENCCPPLQLSLVFEGFSWSSRVWCTYFLAYNPLNNSWKLQDCWCVLQGLPCVLFVEKRKCSHDGCQECWQRHKGVSRLASEPNSFLTSMKQFIALQFSEAAWVLICFRL